jgi:hypothetical protein
MRKAGGGRKKESPVHLYFEYDAVTNNSRCLCELNKRKEGADAEPVICGKVLTAKNPTNLEGHLESCHKSEYAIVRQKKDLANAVKMQTRNQRQVEIEQNKQTNTVQRKMDSYAVEKEYHQYAEGSSKYEERLKAVVRLFASSCLPTYLLDTTAFREFVVSMDQHFTPPG